MTLIEKLVRLSHLWAEANERSLSRLATVVANDGKLFERLSTGATCTVATLERFLTFFRDDANWPPSGMSTEAKALLATINVLPEDHSGSDTAPQHGSETGNDREISAQARAA